MDFDLPDVPPGFKDHVAEAVNAEIARDRPIQARLLPRDQALAIPDVIRTASDLLPPELRTVRVVDIAGLDVQADGGTHVASTKLIGRVDVVKMESKGRGFRRLRVRVS
jgi:misacylated tRNA(Ala) deacylase